MIQVLHITNAAIRNNHKDRSATISNTGELGWFWIRSVDERGNKSSFFPSTTVKFNPKEMLFQSHQQT